MRLEAIRLVLREWEEKDVADLIDGLGNLEVARWLAFVPHPYTRAHAQSWVHACAATAEAGDARSAYDFAIELKARNIVIGGVSLNRINRIHGAAGGGIWLNARYQGIGYGREAFAEKVRFAFEDLNLRRLENGFFEGNAASSAMQTAHGYQIEGMRREAYRCMADGLLKNEYITALLKDEWKRP